ncbi:MAG: alpha/beta fold hydrolase [Candidatus Helarchaeota archaeon]
MAENDQYARTITLKDGRKLGYAEFGALQKKPIFYFHGHRSSRLEPKMYDFEKKSYGVRLIAVDRPGYGLSDFQKDRKILDWSNDILELADALKIDKFAVLGGSGGAPYVAACAYTIPDRITTCGIVSGLGPVKFGKEGMARNGRIELFLGRRFTWLLRFLFWLQWKYVDQLKKKDMDSLINLFQKRSKNLPEPDRKIMSDPERIPLFLELMTEPFRQGSKGPYYEGKLFARDWGFELEEISPDLKVYLWHGELDTSVPIRMARLVCEAIPNCSGTFYPDEAHLSTAINHMDEIIPLLTQSHS